MKTFVIFLCFSLVLMAIAPMSTVLAAEKEINESKELTKYVEKIDTGYTFNATKAIDEGHSKNSVKKFKRNFERLSVDKQEIIYNFGIKGEMSTRVAPLVAFLSGVVAGWVLEKLLDYGTKKFCKKYKNYNSYTKVGCDIFG
ncbi:hypothetical protein [Heyndrickxia acidiproducens]|uniref:hypothetical protein n=1 Tax=Heyndrickxia acidiproducens TaxID=1121084 RepID=UPI00036AD294|nr:hypothetical protein [Heyndrickxia acidiproducens]